MCQEQTFNKDITVELYFFHFVSFMLQLNKMSQVCSDTRKIKYNACTNYSERNVLARKINLKYFLFLILFFEKNRNKTIKF